MQIESDNAANVAHVVLDWPDSRNALGPNEARMLRLAFESVAGGSAGAIVLSARGNAFCSGGNLRAIIDLVKRGPDTIRETIYAEFQGLFRAIERSSVPVIAAVDGPAVGLGCDLAMAADVTFIGERGWFSQGWIAAGLIPATGGTRLIARRGGGQAIWQFLTEPKIGPARAAEMGLAISVPEASKAAQDMADKLARLPREPLNAMRKLSRIEDFDLHIQAAIEYQVGFLTSPAFPENAERLLAAAKPRGS